MDSVAFIAFTRKGCVLARNLAVGLPVQAGFADVHVSVCGPARFAEDAGVDAYESLETWTAGHFQADDALVFVGASGIAVRAIAPHVRDKMTDPAVVSIDEAGRFAIPLLSGHVGGANELARVIADIAGGQAAVSTATDVNGLFAVDEWAARHGLAIVEHSLAKRVSAALLDGEAVGYLVDGGLDLGDDVPRGIVRLSADHADETPMQLGFTVSLDDGLSPFGQTLHLVPRVVTVGIGCRRGTDPAHLRSVVMEALAQARVSPAAVTTLATIDVKGDEPAILQLAQAEGWELSLYSADQLSAVPGEFSSSDFVRDTVGVDNVCERAACAAGASLMQGKRTHGGVTTAIAVA